MSFIVVSECKIGMHMTVATPIGYEPNEKIVKKALAIAEETGAEIEILHNPELAVSEADFIYTDVWMEHGARGRRREIYFISTIPN